MSDQYNNGNLPRSAAGRAVPSRGVPALSLNLGALTSGVQAPMLNVRAAGAAGAGMAALGEGIAGGGDALGKMAAKQAEHINANHILEAEGKVSMVKDKIAARWLNEPDETKWESIAAEEFGTAEGEILHDRLSPDARENISARLGFSKNKTLGESKVASARRSREKLTETMGAGALQMAKSGNVAGAHAMNNKMVEMGLLGADVAERRNQAFTEEAERQAQQSRTNAAITVARTQGAAAAQKFINEHPGDPVEKERQINIVQQIHREEVAATVDEFEDAVALGVTEPLNPDAIVVPGQVDTWRAGDPRIRPSTREQMKASVIRRNDAWAKEKARATAPEAQSALWSEIKRYDPATDTEDDYITLSNRIAELPEGYRKPLRDKLNARQRQQEREEKTLLEYGEDVMQTMLDGGDFGQWKGEHIVYDKKGRPVVDDATGTPKTTKWKNDEGYKVALGEKSKTGGLFWRWLRTQPKATEQDVLNWFNSNVDSATAIRASDDYDSGASTGPKIDPAGIMNDLPDSPAGPPENTLLPNP